MNSKIKKPLKYALCTLLTATVTATAMFLPQTYYKLIDGKNDSGSIIETFDSNIDINSDSAAEVLGLYDIYDDTILKEVSEASETFAPADRENIMQTTVLYTNTDNAAANPDNADGDTDNSTAEASDSSDDNSTDTDSSTIITNQYISTYTDSALEISDTEGITENSDLYDYIAIPLPVLDVNYNEEVTDEKVTDEEDTDAKEAYNTGNDFKYELLDDGTAEITEYTGSEHEVTIPSTIDGYTVTSLQSDMFEGNYSLESVEIPDSITNIACDAFWNTVSLTSINVSSENPYYLSEDGILFNKDKTELITYPSAKSDKEYIIPDSVTSIGEMAFYRCGGLENITIPNSVTSIGVSAFDRCSGLTSLTIPDSVTYIGWDAFGDCSSLTSVKISESIDSIINWTFSGCESLTSVVIPDGVTFLGEGAFAHCSSLTSVTIPDSVECIDNYVFWNCDSLTNITIPKHVAVMGTKTYGYDFEGEDEKYENVVITGYAGTAAETYAAENDITFIAIDSADLPEEG